METRFTRGARIVVAGGANIDVQGRAHAPFVPADSNPGLIARVPGGVGRNIAENLVLYGFTVDLVASVGTDKDSCWLVDSCEKAGIGVSGILRVDASCPAYLCLMDECGSLVGAIADMEAAEALLPEALEARRPLFDAADAIVVDANLPAAAIEWFALRYGRTMPAATSASAAAQRAGAAATRGTAAFRRPLLVLDPVSTAKAVRAAPFFAAFDIAKPNMAEIRAIGRWPESCGILSPDVGAIVGMLAHKGRMPGRLFVSLGEKGMYYSDSASGDSGLLKLPPPEQRPRAVSRSGAGDAACAALTAAALSGFSAREQCACALAAALCATASDRPVNPTVDAKTLLSLAATLLSPRMQP